MPRTTNQTMAPSTCTPLSVRVRRVACALSVLALSPVLLPQVVQPITKAQAQQLPDAATQALFLAVDRNDLPGVREAVDKGADIEARDFTGIQPVDMAIDRGYFEIARYLISVRNSRQANQDTLPDGFEAPTENASMFQPLDSEPAQTPSVPPQVAETPPTEPLSADAPNPFETPSEAEISPPTDELEALSPTQNIDEPEDVLEAEIAPHDNDISSQDEGVTDVKATPEEPLSELDELAALSDSTPEPEAPAASENAPEASPDPFEAVSPPPTMEPAPVSEVAEPETLQTEAPNPFDVMSPPASEEITAATDTPAGETGPSLDDLADSIGETSVVEREALAQSAAEDADTAQLAEFEAAPQDEVEINQQPAPAPEPAPEAKQQVVAQAEPEKPSAAKTFITTFFDFFKPPNVTGVVRRDEDRQTQNGSVSEEELARQLEQIEAERGDDIIKGPAVPISPEELAEQLPPSPDVPVIADDELAAVPTDTPELPPYAVGSPTFASPLPPDEDVFGDLSIDDATEEDEQVLTPAPAPTTKKVAKASPDQGVSAVPVPKFDPNKPFGGRVDPEILAYLGIESDKDITVAIRNPGDTNGTEAPLDASPFETIEGAETDVSTLLEDLDAPEEVAAKTPKKAPSRAADADPFSAPAADDPFASDDPFAADDPFSSPPKGGDVDELAGLLEGIGEDVQGTKGWDVTKVEGADMPSEVIMLSDIEPTGEPLDGVVLSIGADTVIGQEVGEERLKQMDYDTIHKPCVAKGGPNTVFCIDTVNWPFELEEDFLVDTIMYQGTRAIARYDAGRASNFHTLFRTDAFNKVINYYTQRYGQPSQVIQRAIAPLAAPRQDNPTYLWQSREPGTDTIINLEIRKFDDAQGGGFPDTKRGAILLYVTHAKSIFPQLSQLELMVLKALDDTVDAEDPTGVDAPTDPGSIWN